MLMEQSEDMAKLMGDSWKTSVWFHMLATLEYTYAGSYRDPKPEVGGRTSTSVRRRLYSCCIRTWPAHRCSRRLS